jgi:hypothetical protein
LNYTHQAAQKKLRQYFFTFKFTTMKKISTLLVLMMAITSGFAQWKNDNSRPQGNGNYGSNNNNYKSSVLIVNAYTANRFTVVIDNGYQLASNGNTVNAGMLNPGMHNVVVYQWRTNFWGKQKREVVYSNSIFLKPNVETALSINAYGRVNISEKVLYKDYRDNNKRGRDDDRRDRRDDDRDRDHGRH